MKTIIRVPTDQFAYIEQELDTTPEGAVEAHNALRQAYNGGFGLEQKEWNKTLDMYLNEGKMNADVYASMSAQQQFVIQEIKKSAKRVNK